MGKRKERRRREREAEMDQHLAYNYADDGTWAVHWEPGDPPAQAHSPTSVAAAESIKPHVPSMRDRVLAYLAIAPATDEQIATALQLNPSTVRPRRIELVKAGLVGPVGTRLTKSGRWAQTWGVVDQPYGQWEDQG